MILLRYWTNRVGAMLNVLMIDDDVELVNMLAEYLEQEGFGVKCCGFSGGDGYLL